MRCGYCGDKTTNPKFCCLSCSVGAQNRARRTARLPKPTHPCADCGKQTTNKKVCSRKCWGAVKPPKPSGDRPLCIQCEDPCGEMKAKFCSGKCQIIHRRWEAINAGTASAVTLKRGHLERYGNTCSVCNRKTWMGRPMPVVLDHIDGNASNNTWSNTRLVCGNCDMQLPTYKNKNNGKGRHSRMERYRAGKSH